MKLYLALAVAILLSDVPLWFGTAEAWYQDCRFDGMDAGQYRYQCKDGQWLFTDKELRT